MTKSLLCAILAVFQAELCIGAHHCQPSDVLHLHHQTYQCSSRHRASCNQLKSNASFDPKLILLRGGQYNDREDDYYYGNDERYEGNDYYNQQDDRYYKENDNNRASSSNKYYRDDDSRRRGNYYQEEDDYRPASRKSGSRSNDYGASFSIKNYANRKVGLSLVALGGLCMMAGIASFFNKFLLRLAHLFLLAGTPLVVGVGRITGYFMNPKKARATITFGAGFFLVMVGHPFFGMILEVFGFLNLFGNLFPLLKVMLRTVPGIGNLFPSESASGRSRRSSGYYDDNGGYQDEDVERYY